MDSFKVKLARPGRHRLRRPKDRTRIETGATDQNGFFLLGRYPCNPILTFGQNRIICFNISTDGALAHPRQAKKISGHPPHSCSPCSILFEGKIK